VNESQNELLRAFIAYPSQPPEIGATITAATTGFEDKHRGASLKTWEQNEVAGRFISDPILQEIDARDVLVADVTRLNFNVVFEVGYAIGRRKRAHLIRSTAIAGSDELIQQVGIFDTLGYKRYDSSPTLLSGFEEISSSAGLSDPTREPNTTAPVYMLVPRVKTDSDVHLISRVKKARLLYRSFDPEEQGRLPAGEAISGVAESLGVVASLLPAYRNEAEVHNMRVAFVAGLAMGMDKVLLLLQQGEDPVPLDYRDLVHAYTNVDQVNAHVADFHTAVSAELQAGAPSVVSEPRNFLERLSLGASSAENELRALNRYYLETDEYWRVQRGEARVVAGRKGVGKTALFARVRNRLRRDRGNVVLDLKPEGFQLLKLKERVLDYLEEGTREHTITAFWEYLLLLEICHKILKQDATLHVRVGELFDPYRRLADTYDEDDFVSEGDFAERMLKLTQRIADDFDAASENGVGGRRLTSGEITELLYKHDVRRLRDEVADYLELKEGLWVLFDNLDKGWPAYGVTAEDVLTLRCLIEALGKIERELDRREIDAHGVVFIRNDVYELLVANTSDRGKLPQVGLDWTDDNLLRELLRRRLVDSRVRGNPSFADLWREICCTHVRGEESSQYLIDRCLMRPRALIELLGYCRSHAVNLRREKIDVDDIDHGEEVFSVELLANIGFELQDVFPSAKDVLYAFLECPTRLSGHDILAAVGSVVDEGEKRRVFEFLLWYGVFGVEREEDRTTYIYNAKYDLRRLLGLVERRGQADAGFRLNPAFWKALEVT